MNSPRALAIQRNIFSWTDYKKISFSLREPEDHGSPISVVLSYKTSKIFDVLTFSHPKISSYIRLFYKIYSKFFLFLKTEMKYIASEALNVEFVYNNYFLRSKDPIYVRYVL